LTGRRGFSFSRQADTLELFLARLVARKEKLRTALTQRLIEDLKVRNYSPRTIEAYVAAMAKLAKHFQRAPDQMDGADVRAFQVHLLTQKASWSQFNQIVSGLRFFYGTTS
jgi:site-specific recombinase XerD